VAVGLGPRGPAAPACRPTAVSFSVRQLSFDPPSLQHALALQGGDLLGADTEPGVQHFGPVLSEKR
jgi:hypothetical protein